MNYKLKMEFYNYTELYYLNCRPYNLKILIAEINLTYRMNKSTT